VQGDSVCVPQVPGRFRVEFGESPREILRPLVAVGYDAKADPDTDTARHCPRDCGVKVKHGTGWDVDFDPEEG